MRKTFIVLVVMALIFSFSTLFGGMEKNQGRENKLVRAEGPAKISASQEEAKWKRYVEARIGTDRKREQYRVVVNKSEIAKPDIAKPNAANIGLISGSTNWTYDTSGDLVWLGRCVNNGGSGATFTRVDINVYDSVGNYLGSDYTYVRGGRSANVGYGIYTNAIPAGRTGFFRVWTNISYAQAWTIVYTFSWYNDSYSYALAWLYFYAGVYARSDYWGDMEFYGNLVNFSKNYLTYFTKVYFACMDTTGSYPRDVDYNYVDGSS